MLITLRATVAYKVDIFSPKPAIIKYSDATSFWTTPSIKERAPECYNK